MVITIFLRLLPVQIVIDFLKMERILLRLLLNSADCYWCRFGNNNNILNQAFWILIPLGKVFVQLENPSITYLNSGKDGHRTNTRTIQEMLFSEELLFVSVDMNRHF